MDDEDEQWLKAFNSKAEGGSGTVPQSPLKEAKSENSMGPPNSRPRREKGKEKEKETDRSTTPAQPIFISEDSFEFVMGVLEKYTQDNVPTLDMVSLTSMSVCAVAGANPYAEYLPVAYFRDTRTPLLYPCSIIILSRLHYTQGRSTTQRTHSTSSMHIPTLEGKAPGA